MPRESEKPGVALMQPALSDVDELFLFGESIFGNESETSHDNVKIRPGILFTDDFSIETSETLGAPSSPKIELGLNGNGLVVGIGGLRRRRLRVERNKGGRVPGEYSLAEFFERGEGDLLGMCEDGRE